MVASVVCVGLGGTKIEIGLLTEDQVWYMTRFSAANDYNQRLVISFSHEPLSSRFTNFLGTMLSMPSRGLRRCPGLC